MGAPPFVALLRTSSELLRESAELKRKMDVSINQFYATIKRSRQLLMAKPVSGEFSFHHEKWAAASQESNSEFPSLSDVPKHVSEPESLLVRVDGQNFSNDIVALDGKHFIDCNVENCTLEYCGGPVVLEGTNFVGCHFRFGGEAAKTVALLECFKMIAEPCSYGALPASPSCTPGRVN